MVDKAHVYWGNSNLGSASSGAAASIGRADRDGMHADQAFVAALAGVCGVALDP